MTIQQLEKDHPNLGGPVHAIRFAHARATNPTAKSYADTLCKSVCDQADPPHLSVLRLYVTSYDPVQPSLTQTRLLYCHSPHVYMRHPRSSFSTIRPFPNSPLAATHRSLRGAAIILPRVV